MPCEYFQICIIIWGVETCHLVEMKSTNYNKISKCFHGNLKEKTTCMPDVPGCLPVFLGRISTKSSKFHSSGMSKIFSAILANAQELTILFSAPASELVLCKPQSRNKPLYQSLNKPHPSEHWPGIQWFIGRGHITKHAESQNSLALSSCYLCLL